MLDKASPLNPKEKIEYISSKFFSFEVACFVKASSISSSFIPEPLSEIIISFFPAFLISTFMFVAPESIEFSTISFTTEYGFSTTSPAAIFFYCFI